MLSGSIDQRLGVRTRSVYTLGGPQILVGISHTTLGWESFAWVRYTGFEDGGLPMGSIPGNARVMGDLMGTHFGWVVDFFLGGAGEGKRNSRALIDRCVYWHSNI